ncbi:MAG: HIT family protein, partial [Verrucomicrobiia bacterium]
MRKGKGCVFCDIIAKRSPAYTVCEDELSMCILDINPFAKGHCLVIPKRHVPWWHDLTDEETASLFKMARRVANSIMREFKPDFVCMYARGRRIPHTHIFLVPTVSGDVLDRFFNALEGVQESPADLAELRRPAIFRTVAKRLSPRTSQPRA